MNNNIIIIDAQYLDEGHYRARASGHAGRSGYSLTNNSRVLKVCYTCTLFFLH